MPTTYAFSRTLDQVRRLVLRKLRVLAPGRAPSSVQAAVVDEALDLRLKELHALGRLWWNVSPAATDLVLTAGVASASLAALTDFLFPVSAALRIGTEDVPLEIIGHSQYQAIAGKADSGDPTQILIAGGTAYVWPVQTAARTVKLTYQAVAADTSAPDQPDVPTPMLRSLVTLVCADCADDFGVPEQRVMRLATEAKAAERTLLALNAQRVDNETVCMTAF